MAELPEAEKAREQMHKLIAGQLFYDGCRAVAVNFCQLINTSNQVPPSSHLLHVTHKGLKGDETENENIHTEEVNPGCGIDLDYGEETTYGAPLVSSYKPCYVASHKAECTAGAFSRDGKLVATGSMDTSIKILDVDRIISRLTMPDDVEEPGTSQQSMEDYAEIRTLGDNNLYVSCLEFHPTEDIIVSGSYDRYVKFFNFSNPCAARPFKCIRQTERVNCLSIHPSGDFVIVGTEDPIVRLYDVRTCQCFASSSTEDHHKGSISSICYSPNGQLYVTASKDGDIKVWDGVSNKCINTFPKAHDSAEVYSVVFSRNSKYMLSTAEDSMIRLWEIMMARCMSGYAEFGYYGNQIEPRQAVFNHTEDYVLVPDETARHLYSYDTRSGEKRSEQSLGHNRRVRYFAHSPTIPAFVSCSDDCNASFWYYQPESLE